MNTRAILRAAAAAALGLAAPLSFADTSTLNVTATVTAVCQFSSSTYSMSFSLDPTVATDGTASTNVGYRCTKGTSPTVFSVGGATDGTAGYTSGATAATGALVGTGANTDVLPFSITWTMPATTAGDGLAGTLREIALSGTIANADYTAVTADTYSGNVALSITP